MQTTTENKQARNRSLCFLLLCYDTKCHLIIIQSFVRVALQYERDKSLKDDVLLCDSLMFKLKLNNLRDERLLC